MFVTLPRSTGESRPTDEALGSSARILFYDWEPNVIGLDGRPAPTEGIVTGDSTSTGAGGSAAGLTEYEAIVLAAKRRPILRKNDTTWTLGCTPQQADECLFGSWYLFDTASEKIVGGPAESRAQLCSNLPKGASCNDPNLKSVRVNPGTVVVRTARSRTNPARSLTRVRIATTCSTTTRC